MHELDQAVLTSITHGGVDTLLKEGFKPEYAQDPDAQIIYKLALSLVHRQPPMPPSKLNLLAGSWGELRNPEEVKRILSMNGTGAVPPEDVARKCKERHSLTVTQQWRAKFDQLLRDRPSEIMEWLPKLNQELELIAATGKSYNPAPSAHKGSIVPPVKFRSRIREYNRLYTGRAEDGGGYRAGWLVAWLGRTGRGKTTHVYTQSVDAIGQNKTVGFISKENQSQIRARILLGLTGLTLAEIGADCAEDQPEIKGPDGNVYMYTDKQGNPVGPWHERSVRQLVLDRYAALLEKHLLIYDWSFFSSSRIKSIIAIHNLDMLNIDYIDSGDVSGSDAARGLGLLAAKLAPIIHDTTCHVNSLWQISNDQQAKYEKKDDHEIPGPYGSGMVGHAVDQMVQTKYARQPKDSQHGLITKCRLGSPVDQYMWRYLPNRWIFADMQ